MCFVAPGGFENLVSIVISSEFSAAGASGAMELSSGSSVNLGFGELEFEMSPVFARIRKSSSMISSDRSMFSIVEEKKGCRIRGESRTVS